MVIGSSHPVLARVGDEAILPCHVEPPEDMTRKTVEWNRPDLKPTIVHLLQDGWTNPAYVNPLYKDRTSLFHDKLYDGIISLRLSRVKLSDEGTYQCFVTNPHSSTPIQLLVGKFNLCKPGSEHGRHEQDRIFV